MTKGWKGWREYSQATQIALMFPSSIVMGLILGYGLDSWLNTSPWFTIIMAVLGAGTGFWNLYKVVQRMEKKDDE